MSTKRGVTMIELIVYISILTVVILVVVQSVVQMSRIYGVARLDRKVSAVGETALERIIREIRLARMASVAGSTLTLTTYPNFNPNTSTQSPSTSRVISLSGGRILIDGVAITDDSVTINALNFTKLYDVDHPGAAGSQAVRVEIFAVSGAGQYGVSRGYYGLGLLRNSY